MESNPFLALGIFAVLFFGAVYIWSQLGTGKPGDYTLVYSNPYDQDRNKRHEMMVSTDKVIEPGDYYCDCHLWDDAGIEHRFFRVERVAFHRIYAWYVGRRWVGKDEVLLSAESQALNALDFRFASKEVVENAPIRWTDFVYPPFWPQTASHSTRHKRRVYRMSVEKVESLTDGGSDVG